MCIYWKTTGNVLLLSQLQMEQMLIAAAVQLLQLIVQHNMEMHLSHEPAATYRWGGGGVCSSEK